MSYAAGVLARLGGLIALVLFQLVPLGAAGARGAGDGKVILPLDGRMHPDAKTEWWYFTGHLHVASGRTFGFEIVTFKLLGLKQADPMAPVDAGFRIDLAITDEERGTFYSAVNYVAQAPGKTVASTSSLLVKVTGGSASTSIETQPGPDLRYRLRGSMPAGSLDLVIETARPPLLEGGTGVVPMGTGGSSYYYSLTNMTAAGTLIVGKQRYAVTGTTWMDHQWGSWDWSGVRGWDWMAVQLDNGTSIMLDDFRSPRSAVRWADVSYPDGSQLVTANPLMASLGGFWQSPVTHTRYPQGWHIRVPAIGLDARILPTMPNQEVVDPISISPTYWEGSCRVVGTLRGKPVVGMGYTELVGYAKRSALGL